MSNCFVLRCFVFDFTVDIIYDQMSCEICMNVPKYKWLNSSRGGKQKEMIQICAISNYSTVKKKKVLHPPQFPQWNVRCILGSLRIAPLIGLHGVWSCVLDLRGRRFLCLTRSVTHVPWRRRDFMPTPQHFSRRFHFKHCLVSCHVGEYSWKLRSRGSFQKCMPDAHTQYIWIEEGSVIISHRLYRDRAGADG